jgi:hypothetical protein
MGACHGRAVGKHAAGEDGSHNVNNRENRARVNVHGAIAFSRFGLPKGRRSVPPLRPSVPWTTGEKMSFRVLILTGAVLGAAQRPILPTTVFLLDFRYLESSGVRGSGRCGSRGADGLQ